jgi:hypothetical protein
LNAPQRAATGNPREAYAADMPISFKAPAPVERGQLRIWGEGGAIWSGGDPIYSFFDRTNLSTLSTVQGMFALKPKLGWEAASGFDYRFAGSPWHVSGQFRYGEGKTSVSQMFAQTIVGEGTPPLIFAASDNPRADHKETHWLADMALGRDVIGSGPDAMQVKFGLRVAELRAFTNASNAQSFSVGPDSISAVVNAPQENKFLGAGPRLGVDGSVPIGRGWAFDYLSDVAALFGTQKFQRTTSFDSVVAPPGTPFPPPVVDAVQKFGTVFNADIQVGVSYWMSQNLKISASYRLDAFFNVLSTLDAKNDPTRLQRIDRYTHGPRLAVTAQF